MAKTKLYTFYMSPYGAPTKHMVKMASLVVTWMPSLNLERTKRQRSGQVYHTVLPRKVYYSSQVSRVCVACMSRDTSAINGRHVRAICLYEFRAANLVSPLTRSSHG